MWTRGEPDFKGLEGVDEVAVKPQDVQTGKVRKGEYANAVKGQVKKLQLRKPRKGEISKAVLGNLQNTD